MPKTNFNYMNLVNIHSDEASRINSTELTSITPLLAGTVIYALLFLGEYRTARLICSIKPV